MYMRSCIALVLGCLLLFPLAVTQADDVADGRIIYLDSCASCHGFNADGQAPMASQLSTPPADLRMLWARYGNPLPEEQIDRFRIRAMHLPAP